MGGVLVCQDGNCARCITHTSLGVCIGYEGRFWLAGREEGTKRREEEVDHTLMGLP